MRKEEVTVEDEKRRRRSENLFHLLLVLGAQSSIGGELVEELPACASVVVDLFVEYAPCFERSELAATMHLSSCRVR